MKNKRKIICVFLNVISVLISLPCLLNISSYYYASLVGTIFVILSLIFTSVYQRKIVSITNIILVCFILFQFGLPILKAINPNYNNFYIAQFTEQDLFESVRYTVLCIQVFSLGIMVANFIKGMWKKKDILPFRHVLSDDNRDNIFLVAKIVFCVTALIAIPYEIIRAYLSIKNGYAYIKNDVLGLQNGLTNFAGELIVPSLILLIVFAPTKKTKNMCMVLTLIYSLIIIINGSRTVSLALIITLLLMINERFNRKSLKKNLLIAFGMLCLVFIGSIVAQYRYYDTIETLNPVLLIKLAIEEMGFNFTSILFTKLFIPLKEGFKYGNSYISAFICLIPKSLDPTGTISNLYNNTPETWLSNNLLSEFGEMYNFGVGYSVIAESYYNFGYFGFIFVFFQGFIISLLINENDDSSKFSQYLKYIMLISLFTYPRRSFSTLLKCIEYRVVFIIIAIYLISLFVKKIKGGKCINENIND